MLVPKLRFKREDGTDYPEWKKDKWFELGTFVASGNLSKSDLADSRTPCILYGELYTKYGEIAHTIYSKTGAVSHVFSKSDDVILPKSGETPEDISTSTCIPYDNISLGGDLIVFRHNEKVIGAYLSYLIPNKAKNAIASIAQGKSVAHISEKSLADIELPYPEIEEQKKIADFLSNFDEVIAQSEKEVENLEHQKKAAMQKIFSQEVRFKREDGTDYSEWEEKRLNNVGIFIRGLSYCKDNVTSNENDTLVLRSNNICEDKTLDYVTGLQFVDKKPKPEQVLIKNDIVICMANGSNRLVGKAAQYDGNYHNTITVGAFFGIFRCDLPIIRYIFQSPDYNNFLLLNLQGGDGAIANLKGEDILNSSTLFPCLEEQQKIADFLSTFDETIAYAKQELEKWKELKKVCFSRCLCDKNILLPTW